jgi:hypothetical protein
MEFIDICAQIACVFLVMVGIWNGLALLFGRLEQTELARRLMHKPKATCDICRRPADRLNNQLKYRETYGKIIPVKVCNRCERALKNILID